MDAYRVGLSNEKSPHWTKRSTPRKVRNRHGGQFCHSGPFFVFQVLAKHRWFFQGGMLFPCHVVLQQTGTLRLLSFPKQHEVQMDFTAAESFSGSRLLFFIGKW
ncbi:hypothetical protein [Angelakisella massiliensis]|uniref:hypothetical protein n=1 Tax=Angelakisella massiliensis TaxID=1871018 RepID=UPI0024B19FDB|nr:hypothetical protein [Angelakisella massiliensis]